MRCTRSTPGLLQGSCCEPAGDAGNGWVLERVDAFLETGRPISVRLHAIEAELESHESLDEARALSRRARPATHLGLAHAARIIAGERHASIKAETW